MFKQRVITKYCMWVDLVRLKDYRGVTESIRRQIRREMARRMKTGVFNPHKRKGHNK